MQKDLELAEQSKAKKGKPALILVYGKDAHLLETRRWILEGAGMKVTTTTKFSEVEGILREEAIDLFLLCHTLSPEEGDFCLTKATALRPAMKKLVLTANTPLGPLGSREEKISAFDGPKTLMSAVQKILGAYPPDLSRGKNLPN
jgi:DNA-binding NtrC family response regulator